MYPEYCRDTYTGWVTDPRAEDFSLDLARPSTLIAEHRPVVMLLTSPNNPTGTALPLDDGEAVFDATAAGLVVVDEAYAEFRRPGTPTALSLLDEHRDLVVTRTMSKAFAFAGGRRRLPGCRRPTSSTRCASSGCPTTCRR